MTEHFWVRLGGLSFCGKEGCGLLMTPKNMKRKCDGVESSGIKLLRSLRSSEMPPPEKPSSNAAASAQPR